VVVEPGDSLWRIAARQLPPGADADTIDAAWRLWYAANRSVIGADPNLLLPGQQLHVPDSAVTR
jgi:nucleoid-associated protein YgaU